MTNRQHQIAELETQAAEFALVAYLATDPQKRELYTRLARVMSDRVDALRKQTAAG